MPDNTRRKSITLEVCIDSVASGLAAQEGGAHRVELCGNLNEGGVTPSAGMILQVRKMLDIPVHVMIRPRGGDFLYASDEYEVMKRDIESVKELGCEGVVFGILNSNGSVDSKRTRELTDRATPLVTTFHRAFDMTSNPYESLDCLVDLGLDMVLTSGQKPTAWEGRETLKALVEQTRNRIEIMAGSGISEANVADIIRQTGITSVHASASGTYESDMEYRNAEMTMSSGFHPSEYIRRQTQVESVRVIIMSSSSD